MNKRIGAMCDLVIPFEGDGKPSEFCFECKSLDEFEIGETFECFGEPYRCASRERIPDAVVWNWRFRFVRDLAEHTSRP